MSIIAWIVLGLLSGFIASLLVNKAGEGLVGDLVLGLIGAVVGGLVMNMFGSAGVTGFDLRSVLVSVVGAVVVLFLYHAFTGRKSVT